MLITKAPIYWNLQQKILQNWLWDRNWIQICCLEILLLQIKNLYSPRGALSIQNVEWRILHVFHKIIKLIDFRSRGVRRRHLPLINQRNIRRLSEFFWSECVLYIFDVYSGSFQSVTAVASEFLIAPPCSLMATSPRY